MSNLSVSVIIPTYNRLESLRRTLRSLCEQSYPADAFEVIVVDDGSTDETGTIEQDVYPFALRYLRQDNQGEHLARNFAARTSTAQLLVLLDDDITVNSGYLAALSGEHEAYEHTIVLATIINTAPESDTPFAALFDRVIPPQKTGLDGGFVSFLECLSGILSVRREDYHAVGMMQLLPGIQRNRWGGVDFGYRAQQLGFRFRCCPGAVAYHADHAIRDLDAYCHNRETASKLAPLLFQKHPGLKGEIPMFRDKEPLSLAADPPRLIGRKLLRAAMANPLSLRSMRALATVLEPQAPRSQLLVLLYRWIVSAHIYRGYRAGLRDSAREAR